MLPAADRIACELARLVRALGYRARWQPLGGRGVVTIGQRGTSDYFTPIHPRGQFALDHQGLESSGHIPPAIRSVAEALWPLRLKHNRSEEQ